MKKHLYLIAALAFALASCDNSFDIGKIDNEIDLIPGAKVPFPEGTNLHYSKTAEEVLGINGPMICKGSGEETVPANALETGYTVQGAVAVSLDSAPDAYKSSGSNIKFNDAELTIGVVNPAPYPVEVSGDVVIDGERIPVELELNPGNEVQDITLRFGDNIERIPDVIEIQNLTLTKSGNTKAVAPTAGGDLVFKWSMVATIKPEFKPGSVLQFEYAFDDLAFDLTTLTVDVRTIDIKAKIGSTFPVSISGTAASNDHGVSVTLSKIIANTANQDVTLRASANKSVNTLRDLKVVLTAVNESGSVVTINEKCSLSIDLESIVLPDGIKL